jgi:hypothetical protein
MLKKNTATNRLDLERAGLIQQEEGRLAFFSQRQRGC